MNESVRPGFAHRPALDGLRGLAVAAVLLHHADYLPGGYLGVDLFFVLSGFLITSLLLIEVANTGRVNLVAFWGRRARRLIPAAWALIAVVGGLYARFLASPNELSGIRRDALAAFFYVYNWVQVFSKQDYWARYAEPSLFRHFWSLAIEEQFYIFWPVAIIGLLAARRRFWPQSSVVKVIAVFASVGAVVSYGLGIMWYRPGEPTTRLYFGTDTRSGAILLGVVAACWLHTRQGRRLRQGPRLVRAGLMLAAVLLLTVTWIWLEGTSPLLWRGVLAACGVASAVVVVLVAERRRTWLAPVLTFRGLTYLGAISYGLYLWHWPIFVVLDSRRVGFGGPGLLGVRLAVTLVVTWISYYLLEQPIRHLKVRGSRWAWPTATAAVVVLAVAVLGTVGRPTEDIETLAAGLGTASETDVTVSTLLPVGVAPNVAIFGDSVGKNLGEAMEASGPVAGFSATNFGLVGCPVAEETGQFRTELDGPNLDDPEECTDNVPGWTEDLRSQPFNVALLVVGNATDGYRVLEDGSLQGACEPGYQEWWRTGVRYGLTQLVAVGIPVGVTTIPYYSGFGAPESSITKADCRNKVLREVVAEFPQVKLIDLAKWVCPTTQCRLEMDGKNLRPDGLHFAPDTAPLVAGWVLEQMVGPWRVAAGVSSASAAVTTSTLATSPSAALSTSTVSK